MKVFVYLPINSTSRSRVPIGVWTGVATKADVMKIALSDNLSAWIHDACACSKNPLRPASIYSFIHGTWTLTLSSRHLSGASPVDFSWDYWTRRESKEQTRQTVMSETPKWYFWSHARQIMAYFTVRRESTNTSHFSTMTGDERAKHFRF